MPELPDALAPAAAQTAPDRASPRPRAVIFDFDSTLADFHAGDDAAIRRVMELAGCGAGFDEFQDYSVSVLYRVYNDGEDYGGNIHRFRLREALAHFGHDWREEYLEAYYGIYLSQVPVFEGAREILESLRSVVKVGLLTNSLDPWEQGRRIDASGLRPCFDVIGIAAEIGLWKPDRAAFLWMAERLGCEPRDCVFVGDSERHDIEGAKGAGMGVVRKLRDRSVPTLADAVFVSYSELSGILAGKFAIDFDPCRR
jgi:HAD superfamily hydrolase (TIGR01509 family)